jgi:hypothetical protein
VVRPESARIEADEIAAFFALRALAESWRTTAIGKPLDRLWMKVASARSGHRHDVSGTQRRR